MNKLPKPAVGITRMLRPPAPKNGAQMIITDGGMGDLIAYLPAVRYNIKWTDAHIRWTLFCPDYMVEFVKHVFGDNLRVVPFSKGDIHFYDTLPTFSTEWRNGHSPIRTHPTDYAFHMLADKNVKIYEKDYLYIYPDEIDISKYCLPKKYVCIAASGAEPCKTLSGKVIDEIADFVNSKGYTPVFMGKKESLTGIDGLVVKSMESGADYSKGVNLMDKTSMLEAAAVIAKAKAWVGMDGGLMHLAGCTSTPIICGFTLVEPEQVAPYRFSSTNFAFHAVEPDTDIPNRYYQSYTNILTPGDHRKFPGWEKVLASLTADKFIAKLNLVL